MHTTRIFSALILAGMALTTQAQTSPYPAKPVRVVVGFAPGGAADYVARAISDAMGKALGQPLIIENKAGAGSSIAAEFVAKAAPDGYTVLIASPSSISVNPALNPKLGYSAKDLQPVTKITSSPLVIASNPVSGINSVLDLIAMAKAKPGAMTYGVEMSSSVVPMIARLIRKRANIDVVEVPYKTTGQLIQDVVAGRVHYTVGTPISASTMVKAGKLRIIAVTTATRFEGLPDILTVNETIPGLAISGFLTLVAPVATPPDIVLTLNRALGATLRDPELKKRLLQISVIPVEGASPEAVADALRGERERWRGFVKELDIQAE